VFSGRLNVAVATKVYDFPLAKVEDQLVSFLKKRSGESTVADMIAGTGLPKYQVEQGAKAVLDEYAGRLKVTESGELLYYFPSGMRSTRRGAGPALRRFWKAFARTSARVLSLLFKVWIVVMLVGYFLLFLAIGVAAIVVSFAASAASRGNGRDSGGSRGGGGFGGMYLVLRLFDFLIRMWFWSSLLNSAGGRTRRQKPPGRPFYKAVFGFVFGEGDPNKGWEEQERRYIIAYIRAHKGVITLEELMALSGRDREGANALVNRLLLEYEGEPGVTDDGTVVYSFPELMRTSSPDDSRVGLVSMLNPSVKSLVPFSENKPRTNGWIIFFNAFNLVFGSYFLGVSLAQGPVIVERVAQVMNAGSAAVSRAGPALYSFVVSMLLQAGMNPVPVIEMALGLVPVAFSIVFFIVPLLRDLRRRRQNDALRDEALRKRVMAQVLASPSRVDPRDVRPTGTPLDPKDLPGRARRILERIAASLKAEPIPLEKEGQFAYRFADLEREIADLESFRKGIDLKGYEVGKTVFDSGS
jgi:hypothetical protein